MRARATCPLDCPDACSLLLTLEEGRLLRVEGEGEEGVRPFPVQDARPHHLPQGEAEGEGKGPGAHLQDPGAPMGVDQLQDLGQGDGLQVSFQKYPSPMPNTSVRPSGPR
jgi:hypothetical protein